MNYLLLYIDRSYEFISTENLNNINKPSQTNIIMYLKLKGDIMT